MFHWVSEGRNCHRLYTVIAPFWFSTKHRWIVIMPFWLSTDKTLFIGRVIVQIHTPTPTLALHICPQGTACHNSMLKFKPNNLYFLVDLWSISDYYLCFRFMLSSLQAVDCDVSLDAEKETQEWAFTLYDFDGHRRITREVRHDTPTPH